MEIYKHSQSSQNSMFSMSLLFLKKEVEDEVNFLHVDKYQSFLQVDFNTLSINVSYKVILSLLMGMIKYSQSTQSNKFAIFLQYLKKELRNGAHFLHANKHQSLYKLGLFLIMIFKICNIFAIYQEKSVATAFVFYCYAKHSEILWGIQSCSLRLVSLYS